MKRLNFYFLVILLTIWTFGCTYPNGKVTRVENRPAIAIEGAPIGAFLEVDGVNHGDAIAYNGDPNTLLVEPGSHKVRVLVDGKVLLSRDLYLANGETRILTLKRN